MDAYTYGLLLLVVVGAVLMAVLAIRREYREKAALKRVATSLGFTHGSNGVTGDEISGVLSGREVRAWWRVFGSGRKPRLVIEVALTHPGWVGVALGGKGTGICVPTSSYHYKPPRLERQNKIPFDSKRFQDVGILRSQASPGQRQALKSEAVLSLLEELRSISPRFQLVDDILAVEIDSPAEESGDVIHSSTSGMTAVMLQERIESLVDIAIRMDDFGGHPPIKPSTSEVVGEEPSGYEMEVEKTESLW